MAPRLMGGLWDMQATDSVRFCTTCGSALANGDCQVHGPQPGPSAAASASRPEEPKASPRPRWRSILVAVVAGAGLVLSLWGWSSVTSKTSSLSHELQQQRRDATTRAAAETSEINALSKQISAAQAAIKRQPDPAAVTRRASRSVFTLELGTDQGSGFVLESSGDHSTLITNFHVVATTWNSGGRSVAVKQDDLTYQGTITHVNVVDDLATVTVNVRLPALTPAPAEPPVGDAVFVIGSPLGLGNTVTNGIVSALRTTQPPATLQFSAPISPGNSGGPVIDQTGRVVG